MSVENLGKKVCGFEYRPSSTMTTILSGEHPIFDRPGADNAAAW